VGALFFVRADSKDVDVGEARAASKMKIVAHVPGFLFHVLPLKKHYLFYHLFLTLQKFILHIS
jgi:hypothetical protein